MYLLITSATASEWLHTYTNETHTTELIPTLAVLGSLLLKSNSLHITLYFEETLCITVTYYLVIKVTSNILN